MSGHSKWHSIKHKKGAADAQRGKVFTHHAHLIALAAQQGGSDADMNPSLRMAIDKAKLDNVPNANIDRAVKRGTGALKEGIQIEELMYEGFGPAKIALYISVLTDNKNRAVASLKNILTKHGGSLGNTGSVAWFFEKKGIIIVKVPGDKEEAELAAIDAGATDVKISGETMEVYTDSVELNAVKKNLEKAGYKIESAELSYFPKDPVKITDENEARKVLKLMELLEEDDDVSNVFSNFDIEEALMEKVLE